ANLVLLNGNPLENMNNSMTIETVFSGEFYLLKDQREKLLRAIESVNNKSRNIDVSKWNKNHLL
ncbi:MAG: hypothetical protein OEW87_11440, partial [Flavobacteriaceae bacterium]|nr:hypothetical protein [Flavobacteriaceae bacterium]